MSLLHFRSLTVVTLMMTIALSINPMELFAQDPPQRQIRTYLPPEHLVSFPSATPITQFFNMIDPIFQQVTGKQIVDPKARTRPIGIPVNGQYFLDAFESVLFKNNLVYEETEKYFIVREATEVEQDLVDDPSGVIEERSAQNTLATAESREIRINALLFDLNLSRVRQIGFDWNVLLGLGNSAQSGTSSGSDSGGDETNRGIDLFVKTDSFFDTFDSWLIGPDQVSFQSLLRATQFLEADGIGETVAHPSVTVQSGELGQIQIGTDIPIQVRDFAGNTITNFVSTGIIINVTPTLIKGVTPNSESGETENTENPELPFMHLDVKVERSSALPFGTAGVAIDRTQADTQVLLVDDEMTVIGGLISNEETVSRRGIPILKDLPGWFFGLRYLFGVEQKTITQRELLIVLQAELLDPLSERYGLTANRNLRNKMQQRDLELVDRIDPDLLDQVIREIMLRPEYLELIKKSDGERVKTTAGSN